ncbi:uncharacterized protein H6S33_006894 [Morchella sextelata]|uniref:uncharacterized protein n=1 Tax=Morchella sextelata TaxID=1174677 RepID=UPI001D03A0C9|nr:uncharacterized protein H6S33_006894 [Morchella sextelata]KAH0604517.1 hypothetical protein H6S33_006894 [Morchella sextelata]
MFPANFSGYKACSRRIQVSYHEFQSVGALRRKRYVTAADELVDEGPGQYAPTIIIKGGFLGEPEVSRVGNVHFQVSIELIVVYRSS